MFRDEKLELKVGLFIGIGFFIAFLIVFSIKDNTFTGKGYEVNVTFDYVNGMNKSAPVRLAGVGVGDVKEVILYYDEAEKRSRVKVTLRINDGVKLDDDAIARINTLGLLGERYVEITSGRSGSFVTPGGAITGINPINVGAQMERMDNMVASLNGLITKLGRGEGTMGKLLSDETLYNDMKIVFDDLKDGKGTMGKLLRDETLYNEMEAVFGRLKRGEGTIGKLLVDETVYNDMEGFVADIKAHPWKLITKTKEDKPSKEDKNKNGQNFK